MNPIGIERLCLFGMPPCEHVELAYQLECRVIGIGLEAMLGFNPHGYPPWSLRSDRALRASLVRATRECGVEIGLCEGFSIARGSDVREQVPGLDIAAELGAKRINVVSATRDARLSFEGFALLSELAAERGICTVTEIGMGAVASLTSALDAVRFVGRPDFKLLIDTMHFFRLGGSLEAASEIDPDLIGYVQLADAPAQQRYESYMEEALYERMIPGEGALPLKGFLEIVPAKVPVSVEVPLRSLARQGADARERTEPCVLAARRMLEAAQHSGRRT